MNFIIVTGMSGAGKSTTLKFLEDLGFFCVDNMPPALIPKFVEIWENSEIESVALGADIRGGKLFEDLFLALDGLTARNYKYDILFLDASDEVIIKRFKETRRSHPVAKNDRINIGIEKERELLIDLKKRATHIIDTGYLQTRQLKEKLSDIFTLHKEFNSLNIAVVSFGFKYGVPADSDLVFDVRFMPNPFYNLELRPQTGLDGPVKSYVLEHPVCREFLTKLFDLIKFLIPNYINEGKNQIVISIGCTGGRHRSVTIAAELFKTLQEIGHSVIIHHRDIDKDAKK
jgi:UPF0042 nucleotide-binding protein